MCLPAVEREVLVTRNAHHHEQKPAASRRDWRKVHHSPWFWVGVVMFLAAITIYVLTDDLSIHPRSHGASEQGASISAPSPP
jgi:hypothetical protein